MRPSAGTTPPLFLLVALFGASACFRYEPLGDLPPATGAMVRLHLTTAGTAGLTSVLGPEARLVDGVVVGAPDSAYIVAVSAVTRDGASIAWAGETVSLRRDAVAFVEQRTVDRRRSALAAGGGIVAALLAGRLARNGGGGAPGGDVTGSPSP